MTSSIAPCRNERGQVAGIEALPFGLLVFVVGSLLLVNLWGVVDARFAADAAAREAVRYVVEAARADRPAEAVVDGARAVAARTFAEHGRAGAVEVTVDSDGPLVRCTRVQVTVRSSVPAIRLPFIGGFGESFQIAATHAELVDPTRSGVDGRADCLR